MLVLTASAAGGGIRRLGGFGGALIMSPVFMWVLPLPSLVVLVMLAETLGGVWLSRDWKVARPDVPRRNRLLFFSVLAMPAGLFVGTQVPVDVVRLLTNCIVLAFAAFLLSKLHHRFLLTKGRDCLVGVMCGALLGSCGIGGPPAVIYLSFSEMDFGRARSLLSNFVSAISIAGILCASFVVQEWEWVRWVPLVLVGYAVGLKVAEGLIHRFREDTKTIKKICLLTLIMSSAVNVVVILFTDTLQLGRLTF
ncbi:MAG: sulfite exporter TauE/SafE family protein [Betaproteobacteria bacterium]|nr:sulfite exporter TauE/SafE family protein [Betaproteobacteria bacterium]